MVADKGLLFHSLISILARFAGVGLNFALSILLARILTLQVYGDVKMLVTLVTGMALLSRIGVEQLVIKEVASVGSRQLSFGAQFLASSYRVVFFTSLAVMSAWLLLGGIFRQTLFDTMPVTDLMIASTGLFFFNILTVNSFYLKALKESAASSLVQNALPAVSFLLLIFLFFADFSSKKLYFDLYTASLALAASLSVVMVLPWLRTGRARRPEIPGLKQIVRRSLPLAPVSLFSFLMLFADTLMVGAMLSSDQVGLYSTAAQISFISLFFLGALEATVYPRLLGISKNRPQDLPGFFWKATLLVVVALLGVTLFMMLLIKPVLGIFGPLFLQASSVLLILLAAQWLRATSLTFSLMFIIENKVRYLNVIMVVALLVNLVANFVLIRKFGIAGAATGTFLANVFLAVSVVILFYRHKLLAAYSLRSND